MAAATGECGSSNLGCGSRQKGCGFSRTNYIIGLGIGLDSEGPQSRIGSDTSHCVSEGTSRRQGQSSGQQPNEESIENPLGSLYVECPGPYEGSPTCPSLTRTKGEASSKFICVRVASTILISSPT